MRVEIDVVEAQLAAGEVDEQVEIDPFVFAEDVKFFPGRNGLSEVVGFAVESAGDEVARCGVMGRIIGDPGMFPTSQETCYYR